MLRELFRIPGLDLPIYGYGLMLVIACWSAIWLGQRLARRVGVNADEIANLGVVALLSGVVGARISHILENFSLYFGPDGKGIFAALDIRSGGLTYYGGLILATFACIAYGIWKKVPIRLGMDIVAPCLMLGLGLGRVGCFLNGCCWGQVCDRPWGVQFPYGSPPYVAHVEDGLVKPPMELLYVDPQSREPRLMSDVEAGRDPRTLAIARSQHSLAVHPTQLYSTAVAVTICGICVWYFNRRPSAGRVFALMLILEGSTRMLLEKVRIEPERLGPLSFSQAVGIGLVTIGVVLMIVWRKPPGIADTHGHADATPA
jgi:phosphatidylglycerol---prolipoprotein diacylglyceryl transferase